MNETRGVFDGLSGVLDNFMNRETRFDPYYFWEPFDCEEPSSDVIAKAAEDGVDLFNDDIAKLAGPYPRKFQSGMILSTKPVSCIQAGSRVGKSIANQVELGCMISRQTPYCLRYNKGVDTGIKRFVTPENIFRFGRLDSRSGVLIDYNINAPLDAKSWDCGNIIGIGKYPEEKYCPDGRQIWIGTLARSIDTHWWPVLAGTGSQRFLPQEFIDISKGNNGSDHGKYCIHGPRDIDIFIKSYNAERQTFESTTAHAILWDEEPIKPELFISGYGHGDYHRFSFTPFQGKTWSNGLFFGCISEDARTLGLEYGIGALKREDFDYFQASAYDSPYIDKDERDRRRNAFPMHERKAIIWGRYARHEGQPFFNRSKVQKWMRKFVHPYMPCKFTADMPYHGMYGNPNFGTRGLMEVSVTKTELEEEDTRDTWRVYEDVRPGVAYMAVFDPAEGAADPSQVQDKSFGLIIREPDSRDSVRNENYPVIVATTRSTLPTMAFAHSCEPVLRYYNNALLASERGHGKDNEAFGMVLDEYPYWYYYESQNDTTKQYHKKKGFDTNVKTRSPMLLKIREWTDEYEVDEDPMIKDAWIYDELAGAVTVTNKNGKHKCDHTKEGSLDGVICLAIATYIFQEQPEVITCNKEEEYEEPKMGFMQRFSLIAEQMDMPSQVPMGHGVAARSGR